ncbi:NUDIX hydrolase [Haloarcula nitratireducens]|uniref:NUDIX hydrolase n=1 Tax=Haloarcula nitratireducens TaxID=2487749 RepID=A0AAW4P8V3_9EURY|nr:NUDIX hydrolase [Halomicroarcula nitratireducens]MBX0294362.1 NUDIX hydrolase [Halomicroarcula nitratireducens]
MPSLSAFEDDAFTRRVTRTVDESTFETYRARIEDGLEWAVGALTEDGEGRVLFVYDDGRWMLPGGGVEGSETRETALVREVREETGVEISVGELLAVTEVTLAEGDRETRFHFGTYRATPVDTELSSDPGLADEGIERVEWKQELPAGCLDYDLIRRVR